MANFGGRLPLDETLAALVAPWDRLLIRVLGREGHSLLMMRFATPDGRPMLLWSLSWPVTPADQAVQAEWRAVKARSGRDDDPDAYSPDECAFLAAQQAAVLKRAEAHFGERRVADMVRRTPVAALFAPQTVKSMETPPPPAAYSAPSRVFLLGDAAHAMCASPSLRLQHSPRSCHCDPTGALLSAIRLSDHRALRRDRLPRLTRRAQDHAPRPRR